MGKYQILSHTLKLLLIPILAIVLGWILWSNYTTCFDPLGLGIACDHADQNDAVRQEEDGDQERVPWPTIPLATIIGYNPFERPAEFLHDLTSANTPLVVAQNSLLNPAELALRDQNFAGPPNSRFIPLDNTGRATESTGPQLRAVYQSAAGWSALVNNQVVRPGEWISMGTVVKEIHAEGIILEQTLKAGLQEQVYAPTVNELREVDKPQ